MEPRIIADYQCVTGEGPLWHAEEQRLYWVDIPTGRMFRYDPATGQHEQCYQGDVIGGFTIQANGDLLLFMARGAVQIWREGSLTPIIDEIPEEVDSRFNDVIADPMGRVFCGTMPGPQHLGTLYRLDTDGTIRPVVHEVGTSNGMGFTPDRKGMYYTDTRAREIYLYDYDEATGEISNRRLFVRVPEGEGGPDGMTVDAEGYVWSARWNGGCLVRYDPEGREERRIHFPAKKVSSITFGGPDYTDIYVTTAGGQDKANEGAGAGALFHLNLGIRGVPEFLSRVKI
ncbi:MAG TPA: SMP-30/gluconolactonase/LRE family protein [Chloroflexi bacterium]|jgi:D-xylonolactonase|nr:SMP-30/gluconolactonase/LRE family protein [Chloroflexota bacterium]